MTVFDVSTLVGRLDEAEGLRGLLFDYDGTLTPIVEHPSEAALASETRDLLLMLARRKGTRVGVVTGRGLEGLLRLTGELPDITLAVNGGLRIVDEHGEWIQSEARQARPSLERMKEALSILPDGAFVEDKTYSLALHYRRCPSEKNKLAQQVDEALDGTLRVISGKDIFEIQPRLARDKGHAVAHILERWNVKSRCLFAGDDVIDEPAQRLVRARGGVSIQVGDSRSSEAEWVLPDVAALRALLRALAG